MCYDTLKAMSESPGGKADPQKKPPAITKEKNYKELIMGLEGRDRFPPHPKMEKLKSLVLEHLLTKGAMGEDREPAEPNPNTRVMVFVTYRDCVEEVVDYLNLESPIIKATKFVGQGTDKGGRKGFAQKEQLGVGSPMSFFVSTPKFDREFKGDPKVQSGRIQLVGVNVYW
jgi:ATP-dependent DNA helicase MPH1